MMSDETLTLELLDGFLEALWFSCYSLDPISLKQVVIVGINEPKDLIPVSVT